MAGALREAIDRYLLLAGDDEVMQFRHGLVREAVYDELLPGERLALHAAVAAAVETVHAGPDVDAAVASELAHHWYEARDARQALPALAARRAGGGAHVRLRQRLRALPPRAEPVARLHRDRRRADAPRADDAHRRGRRPDRGVPPRHRAGAGSPRRRARASASRTGSAPGRCSNGSPSITSGPATPTRPSLWRFGRWTACRSTRRRSRVPRSSGVLAQALGLKCHFSESNRIAQEALATARAVGSAAAEIRALGCIGRNAAAVGEADAGVRTLREALALARSVGDFTGAAEISIELALALHWAGDLDEACRVAEEGIAESGRWGTEGYGNALRAIRGVSAFLLGRWAEADDWISGALERDPVGSHGVLAHGARALLDLGRGRPGLGRRAPRDRAAHVQGLHRDCLRMDRPVLEHRPAVDRARATVRSHRLGAGEPGALGRAGARRPHARVPSPGDPGGGRPRRGGSSARRRGGPGPGARDRTRVRRTARSSRAARARAARRGRPTPGPRRGTRQGRAEPARGSLERGCVGHSRRPRPTSCSIPTRPPTAGSARPRRSCSHADRGWPRRRPRRRRTGSRPTSEPLPLQREIERLAVRSRLDLASRPLAAERRLGRRAGRPRASPSG